eukprot:COSAG01_NODE_7051_length_3376_cov_1.845896_3_plen_485_part_01
MVRVFSAGPLLQLGEQGQQELGEPPDCFVKLRFEDPGADRDAEQHTSVVRGSYNPRWADRPFLFSDTRPGAVLVAELWRKAGPLQESTPIGRVAVAPLEMTGSQLSLSLQPLLGSPAPAGTLELSCVIVGQQLAEGIPPEDAVGAYMPALAQQFTKLGEQVQQLAATKARSPQKSADGGPLWGDRVHSPSSLSAPARRGPQRTLGLTNPDRPPNASQSTRLVSAPQPADVDGPSPGRALGRHQRTTSNHSPTARSAALGAGGSSSSSSSSAAAGSAASPPRKGTGAQVAVVEQLQAEVEERSAQLRRAQERLASTVSSAVGGDADDHRVEVIFPCGTEGPLGFVYEPFPTVSAIQPRSTAERWQAEQQQQTGTTTELVGMALVQIQGSAVRGWELEQVAEAFRHAGRPLRLVFEPPPQAQAQAPPLPAQAAQPEGAHVPPHGMALAFPQPQSHEEQAAHKAAAHSGEMGKRLMAAGAEGGALVCS